MVPERPVAAQFMYMLHPRKLPKQITQGTWGIIVRPAGLDERGFTKWAGKFNSSGTHAGAPEPRLRHSWFASALQPVAGGLYSNGAVSENAIFVAHDAEIEAFPSMVDPIIAQSELNAAASRNVLPTMGTVENGLQQIAGVIDLERCTVMELGQVASEIRAVSAALPTIAGSVLVRHGKERIGWGWLGQDDLRSGDGLRIRDTLVASSVSTTRPMYDSVSHGIDSLLRDDWDVIAAYVHPETLEALCAEWGASDLWSDYARFRDVDGSPLYLAELPLKPRRWIDPSTASVHLYRQWVNGARFVQRLDVSVNGGGVYPYPVQLFDHSGCLREVTESELGNILLRR